MTTKEKKLTKANLKIEPFEKFWKENIYLSYDDAKKMYADFVAEMRLQVMLGK